MVEVPPESGESQSFIILHLLAEQGGCIELGSDSKHDFFLDAAITETSSSNELIGKVYL